MSPSPAAPETAAVAVAPARARETPGTAPLSLAATQVLRLQRTAGNRAVTATLQRKAAATARRALTRAEDRTETSAVLDAFEALGTAAIDGGGKRLDTIPIAKNLSSAHHTLLEQIRGAMIQAQDSAPEARRSAIQVWPALAAKLQEALDHGRTLGLSADRLAVTADNLALVSESYIHAPHKGPTQVANADDYAELMGGTSELLAIVDKEWTDKTSAVIPTNLAEVNARQRQALGALAAGPHLVKRHRDLLENLRFSLIQARNESPGAPKTALEVWQSIQGEYAHAFRKAPSFLETNMAPTQEKMKRIGAELIVGGAYSEAHQKALAESHLESPDVALQVERFKEAADGFDQLHELALKAAELTGRDAISIILQSGKFDKDLGPAIFELVKNPGELYAKYKEFKEKGLIGKAVTLADIADKTLALRNAVIKVSCEIIKRFAATAEASALKAGLQEAAAQWKKIGEWAEGKLSILEKLGKSVLVISLIVSAIKIVDAIRQGHWGEALKEAGNAAITVGLYAVEGAGGTAMIGGIAVVIAAEIEAFAGAAAMIRWCKDQNVHSAAWSFISICQTAANIEAKDLVADARLLPQTHEREQRALIESRLNGYRPYWMRHIEALSDLVRNDRPSELGGQPEIRDSLGTEALNLLASPGTWAGSWEAMADQIRILFSASNRMTEYVNKHYSRIPKKDEGDKKEGAKEE